MRVGYTEAGGRMEDVALFCSMIAGILSNIHFDPRLALTFEIRTMSSVR